MEPIFAKSHHQLAEVDADAKVDDSGTRNLRKMENDRRMAFINWSPKEESNLH